MLCCDVPCVYVLCVVPCVFCNIFLSLDRNYRSVFLFALHKELVNLSLNTHSTTQYLGLGLHSSTDLSHKADLNSKGIVIAKSVS